MHSVLSEFQLAKRRLGRLLRGKCDTNSGKAALEILREHHEVPDRLPAKVRINKKRLTLSDLPTRGRHAAQAETIRVGDCLDLAELDSLSARYGRVGLAARTVLLDALHRYVGTRIFATQYAPWEQEVDGHPFTVHNDLVTLQPKWGSGEIRDLLALFMRRGVFRLECPNRDFGLVRTSSTATNPDMLRQWPLDSCQLKGLQVALMPEEWGRSLVVTSGFHLTAENVAAARRTVENPGWYRDGDAKRGVAHIYLPVPTHYDTEGLVWNERNRVPELNSIQQDPVWGNRKRLESQAIVVLRVSQALLESGQTPRPPGAYDWEKLTNEQARYLIEAVQVLMPYLLAVQWNGNEYDFCAPTVSCWEEAPFAGGCASDTGYMIDAAKCLRRVLLGSEKLPRGVRERLNAIIIPGWDRLLKRRGYADFRNPDVLSRYIHAGQRRLAKMVIEPIVSWAERVSLRGIGGSVPVGIRQFDFREADTSLVVLAAHHEQFSSNPLWDAIIRYGLVRFAETHLMSARFGNPCGMWRYGDYWVGAEEKKVVFDSYLNLGFHHALLFPGLFSPWFARAVAAEDLLHRDQGFPVELATARRRVIGDAHQRFNGNGRNGHIGAKKDATTVESMVQRQHLSLSDWTAPWTIGPTAAVLALAKAKRGMAAAVRKSGRSAELDAACRAIDAAHVRMLNLSLATIVGSKDSRNQTVLRADGTPLPGRYNVMEAFQPCLDAAGQIRMLPGEHTLPWSAAQLYAGMAESIPAAAEYEMLSL